MYDRLYIHSRLTLLVFVFALDSKGKKEIMKVVLIDIIVNCIDLLSKKSSIYKLGKYQNFKGKLYRFFFSKLFLIV